MHLYIILFVCISVLPHTTNGHKSNLLNFEACKKPVPPMDPETTVDFKFWTSKKGDKLLVHGNVTVKQDIQFFSVLKTGVERKGTFKYNLIYQRLNCKNPIVKLILQTASVDVNEKSCQILKGSYHFKNFDVSKLEKGVNVIPVRETGINMWYYGIYWSKVTYLCIDIRIEIKA